MVGARCPAAGRTALETTVISSQLRTKFPRSCGSRQYSPCATEDRKCRRDTRGPTKASAQANPPKEKVFSLELKYFPDSFALQEESAAGAAQRSEILHGEGLVDALPPDVCGSTPPGINYPS